MFPLKGTNPLKTNIYLFSQHIYDWFHVFISSVYAVLMHTLHTCWNGNFTSLKRNINFKLFLTNQIVSHSQMICNKIFAVDIYLFKLLKILKCCVLPFGYFNECRNV